MAPERGRAVASFRRGILQWIRAGRNLEASRGAGRRTGWGFCGGGVGGRGRRDCGARREVGLGKTLRWRFDLQGLSRVSFSVAERYSEKADHGNGAGCAGRNRGDPEIVGAAADLLARRPEQNAARKGGASRSANREGTRDRNRAADSWLAAEDQIGLTRHRFLRG